MIKLISSNIIKLITYYHSRQHLKTYTLKYVRSPTSQLIDPCDTLPFNFVKKKSFTLRQILIEKKLQ